MTLEKIEYQGWRNCYHLSNGKIELVVTADVGPRIIRFGFAGSDNEFAEFPEMLGLVGGDEWRNYGGHRFWHAPEHPVRTTVPDNAPVEVERVGECVRVTQQTEAPTGIQKEIDIYLSVDQAHVKLVHRLRNHNLWAVELAPWALSVMAVGGVAIAPIPPRAPHPQNLLPSNTLTLWSYTDMSDPRWTWGHKYVLLRQDINASTPQKFGMMLVDGKAAYARNGHLFVKTYAHDPLAKYPDMGCSAEFFTNARFLEVETLGPLVCLEAGGEVEHVENWYLFDGVPQPQSEKDVAAHVAPLFAQV